MEESPAVHLRTSHRKLTIVAGLGIVLCVVVAAQVTDLGPMLFDRARWRAYADCKDQITARLRVPSSAQFLSFRESRVVRRSDHEFTVDSSVESKNALGVMLHSDWACYYRDDGGVWAVDQILIGEDATEDILRRLAE